VSFPWRDIVDIVAVAFIVYNLLLLIRGTRAVQILLGMLFLGVLLTFARAAELPTLQTILENLLLVVPIAVIVLFQAEIRRALATFGRQPLFGRSQGRSTESTLNEIVLAATTLSSRKVGALVVLERLDGLRNYVENGIVLDAVVSYDLLLNIFTPDTPLHDGAAIVQNDRIGAAACFLPLTLNPELSKDFGTRHRAALGISEETDAVAIVVSEESGSISMAVDGRLIRGLDSRTLRKTLHQLVIAEETAGGKSPREARP
jgi:diadenylate cyclase